MIAAHGSRTVSAVGTYVRSPLIMLFLAQSMPKPTQLSRLLADRKHCIAALKDYELGYFPDLGKDDPAKVIEFLQTRIAELDVLITKRHGACPPST